LTQHSNRFLIRFCILAIIHLVVADLLYPLLSTEDLKVLTYPISVIVSLFSGYSFVFDPNIGYVRNDHLVIINNSCSGYMFLNVLLVLSSYYFVKTYQGKGNLKSKLIKMTLVGFSTYFICVFVNSSRVLLGTTLFPLHQSYGWIPYHYLHELSGILYFLMFAVLFHITINKPIKSWNI